MKSRSTRRKPISLKVASSTTTKSPRVSTKVPSRSRMAARSEARFMASWYPPHQPRDRFDRVERTRSLGDAAMTCRRLARALSGLLISALPLTPALAQTVTLKASHQFPGGKGDVRDEMVQIIAREVAAANVGLEIKIFPGSSLVKAQEQWKAMLNGQIDMTSFPLDYASGFHPQFGATLMPGLVKNHEHAVRLNASPFMQDIKAIIERGGVRVLSDAWLAGAFGAKDRCIRK